MEFLSSLQPKQVDEILSVVLRQESCDWVLARARHKEVINCKEVLAAGQVNPNENLFNESGLVTELGLKALLEVTLDNLKGKFKRPKFLVVTVPSMHSFQIELSVPSHYSESEIQFQIEEMLVDLAGEREESMVFDWKDRAEGQSDSLERPLVVATIREDQRDLILSVTESCQMKLIGLALDSTACANGYCQAYVEGKKQEERRFLLLGNISQSQVKLSVFVEGMLFSETVANQDSEFTLVQAISALERLVLAWTRGGSDAGYRSVGLVLTGRLAGHKSALATASRSQQIGHYLLDVKPPAGLEKNWHEVVTAYGALEGMPCA